MSEVENRPAGGVTTAGPEEPYVNSHKYGSVRGALRDGGAYSMDPVRLAGATDRR